MVEISDTHSPLKSDTTNMLVEWGHSRAAIVARAQGATPRLALFSSAEQPIVGTEAIEFPALGKPDLENEVNDAIDRYSIDAIWPQNSARYDLSGLNAAIHTAADPSVIRMVDDKMAFNQWLGASRYRPLAVEATGVDAIREATAHLQAEGHDVTVKPVVGVGGNGYWHLDTEAGTALLNRPEKRTMHPSIYMAAMALQEEVTGPQRMMLMDYLPGPEVSVDLLTWHGQPLIHAARTKADFAKVQRVQSEHEVIEDTYDIAQRLGFHGIVSMQYRLDTEGNWKMLEINPRPAGGSIYSEDAGFGIISNWAKLVTGEVEPENIRQHHADTVIKTR